MSHFDDVGKFHKKFGLPIVNDTEVSIIANDVFLFRYQFLQEELQELLSAHRGGNVYGVADALADLVYVALGTAHLYGIPFDEVFAEVQQANMAKERAIDGMDARSKRAHGFDVVKPEGWTSPDIQSAIALGISKLRGIANG